MNTNKFFESLMSDVKKTDCVKNVTCNQIGGGCTQIYYHGVIYRIENRKTRMVYIGRSINEWNRFYRHKNHKGNNGNGNIDPTIKQYGSENFIYTRLEIISAESKSELKEKLKIREGKIIKEYCERYGREWMYNVQLTK